MALPKPRDKFWVTDPPLTFDDDEETGVVLICVFTTRRKLLEFYAHVEGAPDTKRNNPLIRRYQKLQHYCSELRWSGLAIDPDWQTEKSRIIRFDGGDGAEAVEIETDMATEDSTPEVEESPELTEQAPPLPPRVTSSIITDLANLRK